MAGRYNVTIEQGATWQLSFTWRDAANALVNLTGYSAVATVKTTFGGTQVLQASSSGGSPMITLGGAAGTIVITVPAATTAALTPVDGAVWDLLLTSGGGTKTRLVEGTAKITAGVS